MNIVLDTQSLLVFYMGESGADRVANLLKQVLDRKISGYLNIVNLTELYYVLCRKDKKIADEKEHSIRSIGIKIVPINDNTLWKEAAMLKTHHSLSLADAFAAATAKTLNSKLVTGTDLEFDGIGGLKLERVG